MTALVIIYGNCQAQVLGAMSSGLFDSHYEFVHIPSVASITALALPDDAFARCNILLEQVGATQSFPFLDRLPPGVRIIRFPPLNLLALWPFTCADPRNRPEPPEFPFGRYPYGDRIALQIWEQGLRGPDAVANYAEASSRALPDTNRLLQMEFKRFELIETGCDVKISDYLRQNIRLNRLFYTYNHPTMKLIHILFKRIWQTIEYDKVTSLHRLLDEHQTRFLSDGNSWRPFENHQQPIFPQLARDLNLEWWGEDIRYFDARAGKMATHDEFFESYLS